MFNKEELNKIQSRLEELDKKYNDSIKQIQEFQEQKFKNLEETFSQLKEKQFRLSNNYFLFWLFEPNIRILNKNSKNYLATYSLFVKYSIRL